MGLRMVRWQRSMARPMQSLVAWRVVMAGGVFAIGAGAPCAFGQSPLPREPLRRFEMAGVEANGFFGGDRRIAVVADLDGDAVLDLAIGADREDADLGGGPVQNVGAVRFHSGADGSPLLDAAGAPLVLRGNSIDDTFGATLLALPDLDDDGVAELAIAAPSHQHAFGSGQRSRQQYLLVFSGATLAGVPRSCRINPPSAQGRNGNFAMDLAEAGDVDGDGVPDLLVGCGDGYDIAYLWSGADVASALKSGSTLQRPPAWTGPLSTARADAIAVAGIGDVDGDGFADFALGEHNFTGDAATPNEGRVVFKRGGADLAGGLGSDLLTLEGDVADANFGHELERLGDLDADGADELAIGAPGGSHKKPSDTARGAFVVLAGTWSGGAPVELFRAEGVVGEFYGSVVRSGDLDGDGRHDLIAAARHADFGGMVRAGVVHTWRNLLAQDGSLRFDPWCSIAGSADGEKLGAMAAPVDLAGDGVVDLVVGAAHAAVDVDGDGIAEEYVGRVAVANFAVAAATGHFGDAAVAGGSGLPPALSPCGLPLLGGEFSVDVGNTRRSADGSPEATCAVLLLADACLDQADVALPLIDAQGIVFDFSAGAALHRFTDTIAGDPLLVGVQLFLQVAVIDPAAARQLAISQVLALTLGVDGAAW